MASVYADEPPVRSPTRGCVGSAKPRATPLSRRFYASDSVGLLPGSVLQIVFPGSVLQIVELLENLGTAIRHSLVHDVAVDNTQLLPDSHLDIGPQPNGRTRVQIRHFSHGFLPVLPLLIVRAPRNANGSSRPR